MGIFDMISRPLMKMPSNKTAKGSRRKRHNASRGENKFNLVSIKAGPLCYSCGTYHIGRCVQQRLDAVQEEHDFRHAEEAEPTFVVSAEDEAARKAYATGLGASEWEAFMPKPLRPSGPWNKKLPCGHIKRDKCACYRDE